MEQRRTLHELGLTDYESKVFLACLDGDTNTAKSISKSSGVPYSRIYETLRSLVQKGWLIKSDGRPSKYVAGDIDAILDESLKKNEERIDELREYVSTLRKDSKLLMAPSFSIGYGWTPFIERFTKLYAASSSLNGVFGFYEEKHMKAVIEVLRDRFVQGVIFVKESVFLSGEKIIEGLPGKSLRILSFTPPLWLFFFDGKDILIGIPLDPMGGKEGSGIKYLELNNFTMGDMLKEVMSVALRDSESPEEALK